jgi:hypothetical protein
MKIISTINTHIDGQKTLNSVGVYFQYSQDNIYNICEQDVNVVITSKDCSRISAEYPYITFIYPDAIFPNYKLNSFQAFDSFQLIEKTPKLDKHNECCFVNTSPTNRLFVKKLESLWSLDCYGQGFGHSEIKMPIINTVQVYRNYDICAASLLPEVYKILALRKTCVTPLDHPHCWNVFGHHQSGDGHDLAMTKTYFDLFSTILKESQPDLANDLLKKKEEIHGTD